MWRPSLTSVTVNTGWAVVLLELGKDWMFTAARPSPEGVSFPEKGSVIQRFTLIESSQPTPFSRWERSLREAKQLARRGRRWVQLRCMRCRFPVTVTVQGPCCMFKGSRLTHRASHREGGLLRNLSMSLRLLEASRWFCFSSDSSTWIHLESFWG